MKLVTEYSKQELNDMLKELTIQFQESKKLNLKLNMARGKPAAAQLDMNMGLLEFITAKLLHREGMKIIAVSDVSGGICNPYGLNVPAILDYLSLNRKNLLKDYNEEAVWDIAGRQNATLRTGAYLIAVKRVVEAKAARAIWP